MFVVQNRPSDLEFWRRKIVVQVVQIGGRGEGCRLFGQNPKEQQHFFGMSFLSLTKSYFKRRGVASSCHPRPNHPNWPNIYRGDTVRICLLLVYYFCHWVKWVHQDCGVPSLWGNILSIPIIFCEWIDFLNSHWKLWYLAHGHVSLFESEFLFLNLLWH